MEKHGILKLIHAAVLLGVLPLTGCIVYHGDVSYGEKGKPLSNGTLKRIECGTTSKDWLTATLGEPSQQRTTSDGTEILEYRYSKKKDNHFVMPFLIVNDKNETMQTVFFEISDGVVKNYWKETTKEH
jgi:outer membrane protein assembly factor BamE (lipoprotein component of BamABCDE complex)